MEVRLGTSKRRRRRRTKTAGLSRLLQAHRTVRIARWFSARDRPQVRMRTLHFSLCPKTYEHHPSSSHHHLSYIVLFVLFLPVAGLAIERGGRDQSKFTPTGATTSVKSKSSGRRSDAQRHPPPPPPPSRPSDSHANARRLLLQAKRTKTNTSKKLFHPKSRHPAVQPSQQHRSREQPQKYRQKQPKTRDRR